MDAADIPVRFPIPWGNAAGAPYIRPIPEASQIGVQDGAASLTDGFPPLTQTQVVDGGVPPFGQDANGILKQVTEWNQWQAAGGPVFYDGTFSAAIGGYPKGAQVASATTVGLIWYSLIDANTSNPDAGGGGWVSIVLSPTALTFALRSTAVGYNMPADVQTIITVGYASITDGGGAQYARTGGSTPGGFQTADGAWWKIVSRPLNLAMFGWQDGVNCVVAAQAAYDLAHEFETIIIPDGTTLCSSSTSQPTKIVRWIGGPAALMTFASAVNLFAGVNAPVNYPTDGTTGNFAMCNIRPGHQANYITATTLDDGINAAAYENCGLIVIAATNDPLDGTVHDTVGVSARGYVNAEGGRAYGLHVVALGQVGLTNAGLVGQETDVTNNGVEINGYSAFQTIGLALYPTGTKRCSRAIEIGPAGSTWYNGLHIHPSAIDSGADSFAVLYDAKFAVKPNGNTLIGKDVPDRNTLGVELLAAGAVNISAAANASTIYTAVGSPGIGTIGTIIAQQKNDAGTLKTFFSANMNANVVTAGAEITTFQIRGLWNGGDTELLVVNGSRIGPGTDNVVNCGNPSFRYSTVYAGTGTINTSDVTEKAGVQDIADIVLDAWEEARAVTWQWIDAIKAKGADSARWHYGWGAQVVAAIFEKRGINPWRHAAFCRDKIIERVPTTKTVKKPKMKKVAIDRETFAVEGGKMVRKIEPEVIDQPVIEHHPVFNADGSPVMEDFRDIARDDKGQQIVQVDPVDGKMKPQYMTSQRQMMRAEPVMEEVSEPATEERDTGRWRYGLRNDQCLILEAACARRALARLQAKVDELMEKLK